MNTTSKRAEYVALAGLLFSIFFYIVVGIFGLLTRSLAVGALSWLILAGGLVWLVLLFMFHLRSLAEQEKLDMAQLASTEQGATIFQGGTSAIKISQAQSSLPTITTRKMAPVGPLPICQVQ